MADSQCLLNAEEGSIDGKEKKGRKGGKTKEERILSLVEHFK